jgi:anti-sigma-K factor RskA
MEFKELVGALALDALDAEERAAALAHLSEPRHEGCPEALAGAQRAAAGLAGALPDVRPPRRTWRAIEERAFGGASGRRWVAASGWIAAAAAVIALLILAGQGARLRHDADALRGRTASSEDLARQCAVQLDAARRTSGVAREAIALLGQPGSRVVSFAPQGGSSAAALAVVGADGRRAILLSNVLSPGPARDYELWVIPEGAGAAPIPAGLVVAADGVALGDFAPTALARRAAALAVSAEPKGGSPTGVPTQVVLVAALRG